MTKYAESCVLYRQSFYRGCVGYVHAIGHTLGGLCGISHGHAMAVLLPRLMRQYGSKAYVRLSELADICGLKGTNEAEKRMHSSHGLKKRTAARTSRFF